MKAQCWFVGRIHGREELGRKKGRGAVGSFLGKLSEFRMSALSARGWAHLALWAVLVSFCLSDAAATEKEIATVVVVGSGECVDCMQQNIKTEDAFAGLLVGIYCKAANGDFKSRGSGEFGKDGNFHVKLPNELVGKDGRLTEECFAQMHSASHDPCPATNGLEQSRIVFKSEENGERTFSTAGKLSFRREICTSSFLWPHFKPFPLHKLPHLPFFKPKPKFKVPIPYTDPIYKPKPKVFPIKPLPLPPKFKKPLLPKIPPIYKKPLPPVTKIPPIYKKPLPPVTIPPIYKKPLPPVTIPPIYKKPLLPPVTIPPFYKKPLPQVPKIPPLYKKPCPPFPKLPLIKKPLPSLPKFPPIIKKPWPPIIFKKPFPHVGGGHPFFPPKFPSKQTPQKP
ncbi:hypothetical protein ACLOJK_027984 [Asimina triloba]